MREDITQMQPTVARVNGTSACFRLSRALRQFSRILVQVGASTRANSVLLSSRGKVREGALEEAASYPSSTAGWVIGKKKWEFTESRSNRSEATEAFDLCNLLAHLLADVSLGSNKRHSTLNQDRGYNVIQFPSFKETSHTLVWDKENINEQPLKDTPSYKILIYVLKEIRGVNT